MEFQERLLANLEEIRLAEPSVLANKLKIIGGSYDWDYPQSRPTVAYNSGNGTLEEVKVVRAEYVNDNCVLLAGIKVSNGAKVWFDTGSHLRLGDCMAIMCCIEKHFYPAQQN